MKTKARQPQPAVVELSIAEEVIYFDPQRKVERRMPLPAALVVAANAFHTQTPFALYRLNRDQIADFDGETLTALAAVTAALPPINRALDHLCQRVARAVEASVQRRMQLAASAAHAEAEAADTDSRSGDAADHESKAAPAGPVSQEAAASSDTAADAGTKAEA